MKAKRIASMIMAMVMVFSGSVYAAETEKMELDDAAAEEEMGLAEGELQEIYTEIEERLQEEYLDGEDSKAEDFSLPEEDEIWDYFFDYLTFKPYKTISDEAYRDNVARQFILSEKAVTIMSTMADAVYEHFEESDTLFIQMLYFEEEWQELLEELIKNNIFESSESEGKN